MTSPIDLVQDAARRLAKTYEVDAGLEQVTIEMNASQEVDDARLAQKLLSQRIMALKSAALEIEGLSLQLAQLAEELPFTDQGWAQRKAELIGELNSDLIQGTAGWLGDWAKATANGQLAALERLVGEIEPPAACEILRERLALATAGLQQLDPNLIHATVRACAEGLTIGARVVPDETTRGELWLLLARLTMRDQQVDEVAPILEAAAGTAPNATLSALWARLARLKGDSDEAAQWLEAARAADPTNFDVAFESIAAMGTNEAAEESALEMARLTVGALPSVAHGERELLPLRGEVPGAFWLAMAERAYRENDFERGDWAVREAVDSNAPETILASTSRLHVEALKLRAADKGELVIALVEMGSRLHWTGELEQAREALEEALRLDPLHEIGSITLANTLVSQAELLPIEAAREHAERALALVASTREHYPVSPETAWSYLVESGAHLVLARAAFPAKDAVEHRWMALATACRCIVQTGGSASEWQHLAWVANSLQLACVAERSARHALAIQPSASGKTELAMALANSGKLLEALEEAPEENRAWTMALQAYVALRHDEASRSVELLRTLETGPAQPWKTDLLIDGLLLAGKEDEALAEARAAYLDGIAKAEEYEFRLLAVNAAMVLGRIEEGEELLRRSIEENPDFASLSLLGQLQILRGEAKGVLTLVEAFQRADHSGLEDWQPVIEPSLRVLASRSGIELPPFDAVAEAIEKRRSELDRDDGPAAELERAPSALAPTQLVAAGRGMTVALLRLAQNDPQGATEYLRPIQEMAPADHELQMLDEWIEAVEASELNADDAAEPGFPLRVILPPSWFHGHENPLESHPVFLRYIPEMRLRAGWEVPGVQVSIDGAMEPDRYELELQGSRVGGGRVETDCLYLPKATIDAFGLPHGEPADTAIEAYLPDLKAVPRAALDPGGLAEFLGIPPEEMVVRLIGSLADEHAEALSQA